MAKHARLLDLHNKARLDMLLMFVCIFAIVGGLFVYRSFAATKISAIRPGTYALKHDANDQKVTYQLLTAAGLRYCLIGTNGADSSVKFIVKKPLSSITTKFTEASRGSRQLACLDNLPSSEVKIEVTMSGKVHLQELEVSRP